MGERNLLKWLRTRLSAPCPSVIVGSGPDDCAVLDTSSLSSIAATTDTMLEGTHFATDAQACDVGWKSVAVNLSDLAASGCKPLWGLAAVGLNKAHGDGWARELAEGMFDCADKYGLKIVGGDTTSGDCAASITLTVMGAPLSGGPLLRSGAKTRDIIAVTGELGGSILERHLRPMPRLAEVEKIMSIAKVNSCMDISDGLSLDLSRLCEESKCGALLDANKIPIHADARKLAESDGIGALQHALSDGEDFELLFTLPEAEWEKLTKQWPDGLARLTAIGTIDKNTSIRIRNKEGKISPLAAKGYEHNF